MCTGLALVCACAAGRAWGGYEHTAIAYCAQDHLTERAQERIRYYLDQPIYEYAEWMDYQPVQEYEEYAGIAKYGHVAAVGKDGTVAMKSPFENHQAALYPCMEEVMDVLRNHREMPDSLVVLNLRYLIHMVGDMHCPGHIIYVDLPSDGSLLPSSAWSGNRIWDKCWYKGSRKTIHWLWDTYLQHQNPGRDFKDWKNYLDCWDDARIKAACEGSVYDWLKGCAQVCGSVFEYSQADGQYDESYYSDRARELGDMQLRLAIYRLACLLNECFDYE